MAQARKKAELMTMLAIAQTEEALLQVALDAIATIEFLEAQAGFRDIKIKELTERNQRQMKMLDAFT